MKTAIVLLVSMGLAVGTAAAADLNLTVRSAANGSSSITVQPGDVVNYEIAGSLSTTLDNEGLALFGLTLTFDGGDLPAADIPAGASSVANPTPAFVRPEGITNPDSDCASGACGFGGTIINGDLVQIGGGQNTILNTVGNAPFPIGNVITGIGHTELVLVTGSLTAPTIDGIYHLVILPDAFANVIKLGETGTPFWATEAAGVGTLLGLTVEVSTAAGGAAIAATMPACDTHLTRSQGTVFRIVFDGPVTPPGSGEVQIHEVDASGALVGLDLASQFVIGSDGPNTIRFAETGTVLQNERWYAIISDGSWSGVAPFEVTYVVVRGDVNGVGGTTFADLAFINANQGTAADDDLNDINGSGTVTFADIAAANAFQGSTAPARPARPACGTLP